MAHNIADTSDPLIQAVIAQHPRLRVADGTVSRHALASQNARAMLKTTYPGTAFKVTSRTFSGGSSLYVVWDQYPGAPSDDDVDALVRRFSYGEFDGMDDSYTYDRDPERNAFRAAFGETKYVLSQPHIPTQEETVAYETRQLRAVMNEVQATPAPAAARVRL